MDITIFLAKILGWYLIITSLFTLSRPDTVKGFIKDYAAQPALRFFVATFTLILGLILVMLHNYWVMAWPVIITILAWLTLLAGIVRIFAPEFHIRMLKQWSKRRYYFIGLAIIYLLVGLYLLSKAHFVI